MESTSSGRRASKVVTTSLGLGDDLVQIVVVLGQVATTRVQVGDHVAEFLVPAGERFGQPRRLVDEGGDRAARRPAATG